MPTNEERRSIAKKLRNTMVYGRCSYEEQFYELLGETVIGSCDFYDFDDVADRLADLIEPEPINGETSDGYHTFNELYHHRALLFGVIVRNYPEMCWKSKKHHAGDMYEGMFIVGINTPDGQASYHYDIEPYWDMFECEELEFAPEWDGHTPAQAIERIGKLMRHEPEPERTCKAVFNGTYRGYEPRLYCSKCGTELVGKFCYECGAKVVEWMDKFIDFCISIELKKRLGWTDYEVYPGAVLVMHEMEEDNSLYYTDGVLYLPERMCRNASENSDRFICSECGLTALLADQISYIMWDGKQAVKELPYCPKCGRKVVSDD